ncbi:hypothetical protein NQ317_016501, partial [Molorchus minor]
LTTWHHSTSQNKQLKKQQKVKSQNTPPPQKRKLADFEGPNLHGGHFINGHNGGHLALLVKTSHPQGQDPGLQLHYLPEKNNDFQELNGHTLKKYPRL